MHSSYLMLVYQIYLKDKNLREQREKKQKRTTREKIFYFHEIYDCICNKKKISKSASISSTISEASTIVVHRY